MCPHTTIYAIHTLHIYTEGLEFVQQRVTTHILEHIVRSDQDLSNRFTTACLYATTSPATPSLAVTSLQAKKNLRGFADGTVNLLITTVVAEEGMDVPAANCVLRFDPMLNSVSLVQGRGRARHANSSFIVLSERPDRPTNRLVEAEHQQLEIVRNFQPQIDDTMSVTSASSNAPEEFKTLVDRMRWKMQYEYEQLSEQAFRARAVLFKSEGDSDREAGREELAWSPASGSKQKAKHAAAEMGLSACSACSRTQPPPNSSPAAASATSAPTELQVLQVLVDSREELAWSPASGSKQKAKHAAAEIGLARFQAPSPPAAAATNAPTELQILVDRRRWKMQYEYEQLGEQEFRARLILSCGSLRPHTLVA